MGRIWYLPSTMPSSRIKNMHSSTRNMGQKAERVMDLRMPVRMMSM